MTNEPIEAPAYPCTGKSFSFDGNDGHVWWMGVVKISSGGAVYTVNCRNKEEADKAAEALVIELRGERRKA
jgi:hypothetical protein